MRIVGVDFTSRPDRRAGRAQVVARCSLAGGVLRLEALERLYDWPAFEALLAEPGPWVAGMDFPFGLPRPFLTALDWPLEWREYARAVGRLGPQGFVRAVEAFKARRPPGGKEPRRAADVAAGAASPIKLGYPPVGRMFLEGAPRLAAAGVSVPALGPVPGESRVALEVYPGVLARVLIGRRPYKAGPAGRREERRTARADLLDLLERGPFPGLRVVVRPALGPDGVAALVDEPSADGLDALLAATLSAWAGARLDHGMPSHADPAEGFIVLPTGLGG